MTDEIKKLRLDALKVLGVDVLPPGSWDYLPDPGIPWAALDRCGTITLWSETGGRCEVWEPDLNFRQAQRVAEKVAREKVGAAPELWWEFTETGKFRCCARIGCSGTQCRADDPAEALLRVALAAWEVKE